MHAQSWTDADFEAMCWHDCMIHALSLGQDGEYQSDLVLDLDYILEWIQVASGTAFEFRVAPALLRFKDVDNLQIHLTLKYKEAMEISEILRSGSHWTIKLHGFPGAEKSEMEFDSAGYTQELSGPALVLTRQNLTWAERKSTGPSDAG